MKSYPEQIAELLINAPPAPPLRRRSAAGRAGVSGETKAKLIMVHAAYATFGHPLENAQYSV
jgi:hypothetical protein